MKILIKTIVIALFAIQFGLAQQDAQYTQYMFNTMAVNPAYAGSKGMLIITALHRSQWVGMDGAPATQSLSFHTPISNRVGTGLSIINDEIGNGTNQETYFDGAISYTIPTSDSSKLAFGLKVGGHLLNIDFSKLRNYNAIGGDSNMNIDNKFSPNFGAGVYYYNNHFYSGISVPNFLQTEHFDSSGRTNTYRAKETLNLYFNTGYIFDLNPSVKIKPALLVKSVKGVPLQVDLSGSLLFKDRFSIGASYRWDAALSGLFSVQLTNQFMVGLAYDRETTSLGGTQFNDGSFEVLFRYELFNNLKKVITPRFF